MQQSLTTQASHHFRPPCRNTPLTKCQLIHSCQQSHPGPSPLTMHLTRQSPRQVARTATSTAHRAGQTKGRSWAEIPPQIMDQLLSSSTHATPPKQKTKKCHNHVPSLLTSTHYATLPAPKKTPLQSFITATHPGTTNTNASNTRPPTVTPPHHSPPHRITAQRTWATHSYTRTISATAVLRT